jgi:hypothetical protein
MALGSTQPLTKMSTRNILGGKGRPVRRADNLTAIYEPTVYKMWEPQRLTVLWASTACYRDTFTLLFYFMNSTLKICKHKPHMRLLHFADTVIIKLAISQNLYRTSK